MEDPLFGEQSKKNKVVTYALGGIISVLVLETLIASVVLISKDAKNILLAIIVLLLTLVWGILWRWYRQGDLDPKFMYLIQFMGFLLVFVCIAVNIYIFTAEPGARCFDSNPPMMYYKKTDTCFKFCEGSGMCLMFSSMQCLNCSALLLQNQLLGGSVSL